MLESEKVLLECIALFKQKKKDNPYWAVNYKRPLKTKEILKRL